jgi:large subunit ribosomal protein L30|tara:strand:+ start:74 stop:268 length:195 start_codon:yes stop_codon:yes gene_type:complete
MGKIMVSKIYVKQIRSPIRRPEVQRKILKGLGLNKINKVSELNDTPSIRGMINKIPHLVQILDK